MEIRQLRYFLKIADFGSLSKAAQVLYVAQPALSQQMTQLEAELGQQLLHRKYNGVQMSEQGEVFYRHAQRILKQIDELPNMVRQAGVAFTGTVTVGLPQSTAVQYAMHLLDAVGKAHEGVSLEFFDEISGNLLRGLDSGRFDLAVIVSDQDAKLLDAEPLMDEELFLVATADKKLPATVNVSDLSKHVLALPGVHHGVRALVEEAARAAGSPLPRPFIVANSMSIMRKAIESGVAAGIMPWAAVSDLIATGHLQAVPLVPRLTRRVHVCNAKDGSLSLAAQAVKLLLLETTRERVRSGAWQGVELL